MAHVHVAYQVASVVSDSFQPYGHLCPGILQARTLGFLPCSGLSCLPPGDLPDPGIEPVSPVALPLHADSLLLSHQGSSQWPTGFQKRSSKVAGKFCPGPLKVRPCSVLHPKRNLQGLPPASWPLWPAWSSNIGVEQRAPDQEI